MKRFFFLLIFIMCLIINTIAQTENVEDHTPKKDIHVNREYDASGNLIKFDSVYSFSWSGDTTLQNSVLPQEFQNLLGDQLNILPDSGLYGDSFFKDFDPFFSPFSGKKDSMLMKKFGMGRYFQNFDLQNDSITMNFSHIDDFLNNFMESPRDSTSLKMPGHQLQNSQSKSMEDLLKLLQIQMQEMEIQGRNSFKEQPKLKKF
jgi:hypothetical protein